MRNVKNLLPSELLSIEGCHVDAAQIQAPVLEAIVEVQVQVLDPRSQVSRDPQRIEQAPLIQIDHAHQRP